jgi:ubiquitin carboxyl-terminal hydrolase 4/11/15
MEEQLKNYINEKKKLFENDINKEKCEKIPKLIESLFIDGNILNTPDDNKYFYVINFNWLSKAIQFIKPFENILKDKVKEKKKFIDFVFDKDYIFSNFFDENDKSKDSLKKYPAYPGPINNYPIKDFKDSWNDSINLDENDFIKKGLKYKKDYMLVNSSDWEFLKSIFDCTNEIKRTINYSDLIKLKFILFDKRINERKDNMNLLKQKYIQINKNSTIKQLKEKIKNSVNEFFNSKVKNNQQELIFYLLNKEDKNILIEMVSAVHLDIPMYESLYIEKMEFQDDNTLNDFFEKYDKNKHILIIELINKEDFNFLIQLDNNYKCSVCNKKIENINEKYNCDYCHYSLFCSSRCSNGSNEHNQIDSFLRQNMQSKFNLSDFLSIKFSSVLRPGTIKGIVGLYNLGSTCYLNSVLQCLSHTEDLTKYFLKECFKKEINIGNSNTKGNFLDVYYRMISLLWNASGYSHDDGYYNNDYYHESNKVYKPTDFASFFCNNQTKDTMQDAYVFLSTVLNHFHQDLKRVSIKQQYKLEEQKENEDDETASNRFLDYDKRTNDSIIYDLFRGQYKYTTTFSCGHKSIKYDTFISLELPIPTKKTDIQFKLFTQNGNFIDINMKIDEKTEMKDLILKSIKYLNKSKEKEENSQKDFENIQKLKIDGCLFNYNIKMIPDCVLYNNIQVIEFNKGLKMINIYNPSYDNVNKDYNSKKGKDIPFDNCKYLEFTKKRNTELIFFEKDINSNLKEYTTVYIYPVKETEKEGMFLNTVKVQKILSFPIVISIKKSQSLRELEEIIHEKYKKIMQIQAQNISNSFEICYPHFSDGWETFSIKDGRCPVCTKKIDSSQKWCGLFNSVRMSMSIHQFMLEKNKNRPLILFIQSCFFENGLSLYRGMKLFEKKYEIYSKSNMTLYDSLDLLKTEEILDGEICNKCKKKGKAVRKVEIYKSPYYLIIQLKRFKQNQKTLVKNETFIDYKEVLNLEDFVLGPDKNKSLYDLYGVVNHRKFMNKVHHTAFCKNLGLWFLFDDKEYKIIDNIVSKEAYILFYKRRNI